MKVWCDSVIGTAIGATGGTYDSIGTVTIKKGAQEILGFIVLVTDALPGSGLNGVPILQVSSKDLGISEEKFVLGLAITDGIATNDKEAPVYAEFIPFKSRAGKSLDNAKIDFKGSANVTKAGGFDFVVGVVYADGAPDQQFIMELMAGITARAVGGDIAESDAGISAASETAFTEVISVTSEGTELIGLSGFVNMNAPTAEDNCIGYVKFTANQINDFAPQIWPFNFGYTASLGTPVGTPVPASRRNGFYHPTRFPLPQVNFDISVAMKLAEAQGAAGDGVAAAKWR